MKKIKTFYIGIGLELPNGLLRMERNVNEWLETNNHISIIDIKHVQIKSTSSFLVTTILYSE